MKKNVLIVSLLAFSLIFALSCKKDEPAGVAGLKNYINKNAAGYVVINFKAASEKGLFDELLKDAEAQQEFDKIKTNIGLDVKKDLESGVMVLMDLPSSPMGMESDFDRSAKDYNMYLFATGNFNKNKILDNLKKEMSGKVDEKKIEGNTIYHHVKAEDPESEVYLSFLSDNSIMFAPTEDLLTKGIKTYLGKEENISADPKKGQMFDDADKNHMIWGVFGIPKTESSDMTTAMFPAFEKIEHLYFGGTYQASTLTVDMNLYTSDNQAIKDISTSLNGFINMMKMGASENPEIVEIIDQINISQEPDSVKISFKITKEQIESMKSFGGGMMGGGGF